MLKSSVRNGENSVLQCFSSHARTGSRQHCFRGASAMRHVISSIVTLSTNASMLDSCLFMPQGGGAIHVDCRILSTFSSKNEANSSAECPESILAHLSPVRIPGEFQRWCGLDCSDSMRSLQYFDFLLSNNWCNWRLTVAFSTCFTFSLVQMLQSSVSSS